MKNFIHLSTKISKRIEFQYDNVKYIFEYYGGTPNFEWYFEEDVFFSFFENDTDIPRGTELYKELVEVAKKNKF